MRKKILDWLRPVVDLREGTDVKGTIESIRKNITIRGFNVWILAAAAMIASIGLYQDSVAVIIGAMLISPLMSPILGVGLSIGINDRDTLFHSLENLAVAVVASVLMSTLFFWVVSLITPVLEMNPQIEGRTRPTLFDVAVGFFGGVAGIVSVSRKDITWAIPGVAIATALMPPLCVTGFGIVYFFQTGRWEIFAGAFYLFFLNATFIALSTYLIVRYLNFPYVDFIDQEKKRKVTRWMIVVVSLILIPSGILFFNLIRDLRNNTRISMYLKEQINGKNHWTMQRDFYNGRNGDPDTLRIIVDGSTYIDSVKQLELQDMLGAYRLENTVLDMRQMIVNEANIQADLRASESRQETKFVKMMEVKEQVIDDKDKQILQLQQERDSMRNDAFGFGRIVNELKIIYPDLNTISLSNAQITDFEGKTDTIPQCVVKWRPNRNVSRATLKRRENQMAKLLIERMDLDTIKVIRE